jgi:class 3 adenylate cyclase/predicted ATPase
MTFYEVLEQVIDLLQRYGRVSYRALRRQFELDDTYLEDLKAEIIEVQQLAVDQDGTLLIWTGGSDTTLVPVQGQAQTPAATPSQIDQQHDMPVEQIAQPALLAAEPVAITAERRQLTVMFCDLVGSTALSSQLDPEELRDLVLAYQKVCAEVTQRFDGHIAQYLGDGVLVYFGYPLAHEDDAQRAVRAGLEIVEAIGALHVDSLRERGIQLGMRVGIHTGLVVVGDVGGGSRQEQLALGETPNIAARIQELAEPNTVVISATSQRLVQGYFVCHDLDLHAFKGSATPVQVYRVLHAGEAQSRFDVAITRGLTPLVGREQEVQLLLERWERATDGMGQVVLLSGEAGIGKSRLVEVLKDHLVAKAATWEYRCLPYHQHSAFYPVIAHLQRVLAWRREDPALEKLRKIEEALAQFPMPLPEVVPLFAQLLSLPLPERYPPLDLTPQRQKQKTLEALLVWLLQETERQPVLFVVEDLHWSDPSTVEFLSLLIDQVPTTRLCMVCTFRPVFRPPWTAHAHLTQVMLDRLPRHQAALMIERVTGGKALPAEVHRQLVAKTDGVPLFVEELTKMVLESGWLREAEGHYELIGLLPPLAIPTTLHDSLMARLDRLAMAKTVAQLGATIGRQFSYELLQAVSPGDEATLQHALDRLVEVELLYQRGLPPQATYMFKHALIQEVAYQSLLKSTRQHYHRQIAQALAERFVDTAVTQPELLAHHYTEAGLSAQAVPYWQQAGQRAVERSANVEAISHLTRGLEVLRGLPATPERIQQELTLQLALGLPLLMLKGHTAPEVEHAYSRALALCQQVGDSPQRFAALEGLWAFYNARGMFHISRELAEQSLSLAQGMGDALFLHEAHVALGTTLFSLGEFVPARTHLEQACAFYTTRQGRSGTLSSGTLSSGVARSVSCFAWASWALWMLGYPDRALTRSHESLTMAQALSHGYSLGFAVYMSAILHQYRREVQAVQEQTTVLLALASEEGFTRWLAGGTILQGWALAAQGSAEAGIKQIHQGLTAWRAMGGKLALPYLLGLLAEAYGKAGQAAEGLRILAEALALVHEYGERRFEAELHRLKGELLLQAGVLQSGAPGPESDVCNPQAAGAETCFHQAIDIARHQHAKSLELRAVISLSRLWQTRSKRAEAHQMLAETHGWFTEGFATPNLQEAEALLAALA